MSDVPGPSTHDGPGPSTQSDSKTNMDFNQLGELYQCFMERWHGLDKGLTRAEFQVAMKKTVSSHRYVQQCRGLG
jgi:hypothetical protein